MKTIASTVAVIVMLASALVLPAKAEIVYTQANASIPVGGSYGLDLNGDGVIDFTLKSKLLQGYCQWGDEYDWNLTVTSGSGNAVVVEADRIGSDYAAALSGGVAVNSGQAFYPGASPMAELYWGVCGTGTAGEWLNLPTRYLGLQLQDSNGNIHYGWAQVSTAAYVDEHGHLHADTFVFGFAYETVAGQAILTGQLSDEH